MDAARYRSPPLHRLPMGQRIAALALTLLAALVLGGAGASKLAGAETQRENFEDWDLPQPLRPAVGAVEVLLAILLLIPATRFWGAAAMGPWTLGAVATHLRVGQFTEALPSILIGALGLTAAWLLWPPGLPARDEHSPEVA